MKRNSKITPSGNEARRLLIFVCACRTVRLVESAGHLSIFYICSKFYRCDLYNRFRVFPPVSKILLYPTKLRYSGFHFDLKRRNEQCALTTFHVCRAHFCEQTTSIVAWWVRFCRCWGRDSVGGLRSNCHQVLLCVFLSGQ